MWLGVSLSGDPRAKWSCSCGHTWLYCCWCCQTNLMIAVFGFEQIFVQRDDWSVNQWQRDDWSIWIWPNMFTKRWFLIMTIVDYDLICVQTDDCWFWPDTCTGRWLLVMTRYVHRELIIGYVQMCVQRDDCWLWPDMCAKRWLKCRVVNRCVQRDDWSVWLWTDMWTNSCDWGSCQETASPLFSGRPAVYSRYRRSLTSFVLYRPPFNSRGVNCPTSFVLYWPPFNHRSVNCPTSFVLYGPPFNHRSVNCPTALYFARPPFNHRSVNFRTSFVLY